MKDLPRTIHFVWIGEKGPPEDRRGNPDKWKKLNPEWDIIEWDEGSLRAFILANYPQYFEDWCSLDLPVKQSDMARILLMHFFGGMYVDYDLIPLREVDSLFRSNVVLNRCWEPMTKLPDSPAIEKVDFNNYKILFSKEPRQIDAIGYAIANNILISVPGQDCWIRFLELQIPLKDTIVLNFVGPWALTRFIRSNMETHFGSHGDSRALGLPIHYFIWEKLREEDIPPDYAISWHPAVNTWGDFNKPDWWIR